MPANLTIRVDASADVGLGHLSRCLTLAHVQRRRGGHAAFVLGDGQHDARQRLAAAGFDAVFPAELSNAPAGRNSNHWLLMDVIHTQTMLQIDRHLSELSALRRHYPLAVFDGSGEVSLRRLNGPLPLDLLIAPYVDEKPAPDVMTLAGPAYFPLADAFREPPRAPAPTVRRILVTSGGGDPVGATLLFLRALALVVGEFEIEVVIGPMFTAAMIAELETLAAASPHPVGFARAPASLAPCMRVADLCLATSGLTKYELAALGVPAILVSIDDIHATIHLAFDAVGSARHIGVVQTLRPTAVAEHIRTLLDDHDYRSALSAAGRNLVDGGGADRILDAMEQMHVE